ncbi:Uncharacterised protein [Halioglobus japonicus]|nr:Uncharacterised protein [Halioglobus japonicus]
MKPTKARFYLLCTTLACGLLLSSCGGSNSGQSGSGSSDTAEPPTESPAIAVTTQWSAVDGTLALELAISQFTSTRVRLYPRGIEDEWVETDATAPYSFIIDITDFEAGDYQMLIIAENDDAEVQKNETVTISGCNGEQSLCNRSYDQVRYVTTHNAMSSSMDGWVGPNQNLDVPAQLQAGVRGLMLDLHRAGNKNQFDAIQVPDADPDDSFLCHSVCALGKQPLAEGLAEVREFLDNNPGAVITFIFESYLSHELTANAFDEAELTPYTYVHTGEAWPTLGQMIDAGTRLVVLQDTSEDPMYPWLMNVWSHAFETHYSALTPEDFSCDVNRGTTSNDLFIFNHFLTDVFGAPELAEQVNHNPYLLNRINECEAFHGVPGNFITVDYVDIGDAVSAVKTLNDSGGF